MARTERSPKGEIRVRDLPDQPKYGVSLYCPFCQATYSACKGDYFLAHPDMVMECCEAPLVLTQRSTRYLPIHPNEARQ